MKKKICLTLIMLFIAFVSINVYADELYAYSTLEKSDGYGELYNSMPTEVKRGDVISVKIVLKGAKGWNFMNGTSNIYWDKNAFEIVEIDKHYIREISRNLYYSSIIFGKDSIKNYEEIINIYIAIFFNIRIFTFYFH